MGAPSSTAHSIDIQYDGYTQMVWALPLSGARVAIPLPHVTQPSWSPDSKTLAVVRDNAGKYTIQLLRGGTFAVAQTVALPSSSESLVWSPDGSSLAFTLMTREAADSRGLYAKFSDHGVARVGLFSVNGPHKVLASGLGGAFSVSRDGTIAYSGARADGPNELLLQTPGKPPETLTSLNPSLQQRQLGKLVHLSAESRSDGVPSEGWALLPPGSTGHTKLPTVLMLHGGPLGTMAPSGIANGSSSQPRAMPSCMETTAAPPPTVQPSLSRRLTAFLVWRIARPSVWSTRASARVSSRPALRNGCVAPGAELTVWITGKTHRFRAAAAEKPPIEAMSEALTSDQYLAAFLVYGGAPWMHEKKLWENSPLSLAESVTTPTLFIVARRTSARPLSKASRCTTPCNCAAYRRLCSEHRVQATAACAHGRPRTLRSLRQRLHGSTSTTPHRPHRSRPSNSNRLRPTQNRYRLAP